jgi:glycerophosphoryl diester phosphodiesterase
MSAKGEELFREPSDVLLIHHMANRDHGHPPGTLLALRGCLEAGARVIEIDISLLADHQFALLHGPLLEHETTGSGPIRDWTAEKVREHQYLYHGKVTEVAVGLLPEAVELLQQHPGPVELQLDLKPDVYSADDVLSLLVISPTGQRSRSYHQSQRLGNPPLTDS